MFGRTIVLKERVKCVDEDEDLNFFGECCEYVCKTYMSIKNEDQKTEKED